ncbi:MAG: response regulator [Patescibacteria group bacterium]|nr:response regulator [Patescibacteria group bacterium]
MKRSKKILVVDDDYFFRRILTTKLRESGFEVLEARNGREGIGIIEKREVDLMLLDLMMPFYDGFDILEELDSNKKLRSLPVIVMSLLGQKSDIEKVKKYEILDYVVKPDVSIKEIEVRVKKYLAV